MFLSFKRNIFWTLSRYFNTDSLLKSCLELLLLLLSVSTLFCTTFPVLSEPLGAPGEESQDEWWTFSLLVRRSGPSRCFQTRRLEEDTHTRGNKAGWRLNTVVSVLSVSLGMSVLLRLHSAASAPHRTAAAGQKLTGVNSRASRTLLPLRHFKIKHAGPQVFGRKINYNNKTCCFLPLLSCVATLGWYSGLYLSTFIWLNWLNILFIELFIFIIFIYFLVFYRLLLGWFPIIVNWFVIMK